MSEKVYLNQYELMREMLKFIILNNMVDPVEFLLYCQEFDSVWYRNFIDNFEFWRFVCEGLKND